LSFEGMKYKRSPHWKARFALRVLHQCKGCGEKREKLSRTDGRFSLSTEGEAEHSG